MLAQHSGEGAIGIDNWAAVVIEGARYRVVSRDGFPGSVGYDGSFSANRTGAPGLWRLRLDVDSGLLERTLPPQQGAVSDLLAPPKYIVQDSQLAVARAQNPDDGHPAAGMAGLRREGGSTESGRASSWWHYG